MASVKKAKPSSENGIPMMAPAYFMNSGHSRLSSNDSTVPDTAPTANRMAVPLAQRLASSRYVESPVVCQRCSASTMRAGMATPMAAKMMWNANDIAICERAAKMSVI